MTHPEAQLAPYVDGRLSAAERGSVEAHVATCPRCAGEIGLARAARTALASLPEPVAPADVTEPALTEAARMRAAPARAEAPRWQRWGVVAAAAAAGLLALAVILPKVGGDAGSPRRSRDEAAAAPAVPVRLEIQGTDYDSAALARLASEAAAARGASAGTAPTAGSVRAGSAAARIGTPAQSAQAATCVAHAFARPPGTLVRLVQARFQGVPAYLGFYEEGPGAGQPADTLTIRVAAVHGCSLLSTSQIRL
jgi:Putative zinc-finger